MPQHFAPILWNMDIIVLLCIWYFNVWILVQLHQFWFYVTQIHCNDDQKIVAIGSSCINMNNCHNIFLPYCGVWILLSHRDFDIFWVNIGPAPPISFSHGSDSVVGNSSISINMNNYHNIFTHFLGYGYCFTIDPLIVSSLLILVQLNQSFLYDSDSVSWWSPNSNKMAKAP